MPTPYTTRTSPACINVVVLTDVQERGRQGDLATHTSLSDSNTIKYSGKHHPSLSLLWVCTSSKDPAKNCRLTQFYPLPPHSLGGLWESEAT